MKSNNNQQQCWFFIAICRLFILLGLAISQTTARGCLVPRLPFAVVRTFDNITRQAGDLVSAGHRISIACQPGAIAGQGGGSAICIGAGTWNIMSGTIQVDSFMACLKNCVDSVPPVANGRLIGTGNHPGASRQVVCDSGHVVVSGQSSIFCNGSAWSRPGKCGPETKACSSPPHITNGHYELAGEAPNTMYLFPARLQIRCSHWYYILAGPKQVRCRRGGSWTEPGSCEWPRNSNYCRQPPAVENGGYEPRRYGRDIVCFAGFRLVGRSHIVCDVYTRTWSMGGRCVVDVSTSTSTSTTAAGPSTTTTRSQTVCSKRVPTVRHGGYVQGPDTDSRTVRCDRGYTVRGVSTISCIDGTWSKPGRCVRSRRSRLPRTTGPRRTRRTTTTTTTTARPTTTTQSGSLKVIEYPGNGANYQNNASICWLVSVPSADAIRFTLTWTDMASNDGIDVYSQRGRGRKEVFSQIYSKIREPQGLVFFSPTARAKVCFTSDMQGTGRGFKLSFQSASHPRIQMPVDCQTLLRRNQGATGRSVIYPRGERHGRRAAYCDMDTFGGGWTVIQRRVDDSLAFDHNWEKYKQGFGNLTKGTFWLGNQVVHKMTSDNYPFVRYNLLVRLKDTAGRAAHLYFENFRLANEAGNYKMHYNWQRPICNTTDATPFVSTTHMSDFSTMDRDNDGNPGQDCSRERGGQGGWWFSTSSGCGFVNLNGVYGVSGRNGIITFDFSTGSWLPVAQTEMMIRRAKSGVC